MGIVGGHKVLIAQFQGISIPSEGVKFQTRSKWSHSALVNTETEQCAEALFGNRGWTISDTIHQNHAPGTVVDLFYVPGLDEEGAWQMALDLEGTPYDHRAIVRFVTRKPFHENGKLFCSEGVAWICREKGVILQHKPDWEMAPEHVGISVAIKYLTTVVTT